MSESFVQAEQHVAHLHEERARGDAFERVVAHFLRNDPTLGMRRVWTWIDWPGRVAAGIRATDLGIDLVAEDELGELVGVQVKFRLDPRSHLRWEEVSTALGFRPDLFARRLIVTNAADRTANARRATEMTPNTGWVLREDLVASPIDWTGALAAGTGEAVPVRFVREPRPYQASAVADVVAALADHERTQLVMACGSGKTLVTLWIAEERADERVLVLVPTLLLLKQFRREWREAATLPFVDLAVCSDADTVEPDEWRVRADELGVPVTTDANVIAAFLRGPGRRVVFATYASSARIADAQADATIPAFDLVVADEAHRIAGIVNTGVHRDRDLRVVLDADRIRADRRLFTTATPRVYGPATRRRFDDLGDVEVASMDDEALFGPVAHQLWFREAVDLEVLTDYELVAVLVTDEEVADLVRDRAGVIVDGKVLDAETLATLIAVRRAIEDLGLTRAITFHHTIARARRFAHALAQLELTTSPPDAQHISGAMPVDERERVLHILKNPGRPTVVTNARCLTEGIDVPSLDAVAFVDPRSSAVDIVQAVGRVMRRAPGKERGYVVVPVFLRETDLADPEAAVESSAFERVLAVLRALRAHDPDLVSDATRIAASLGRRDGGHIRDHLQLLGATVDVGRFERALELRFVDVAAVPFEVAMTALRAFAAREGHARVPVAHVEVGFRLGYFVNRCRWHQKVGLLSLARAVELEAIPGWSWDPQTDEFWDRCTELAHYAEQHGHVTVPRSGEFAQLARWATHQRELFTKGLLGTDRVLALEQVPGWHWNPHEEDFEEGMAALESFARREGHSRVPSKHEEGGFPLGSWTKSRRREHALGLLREDRVARLEALKAWSWSPRADRFQTGLQRLRDFADREGHTLVLRQYRESGFSLGDFVAMLRSNYAHGRLTPGRVAAVEAVPHWVWREPDPFVRAASIFERYVARTRTTAIRVSHIEDGFKLGVWVSNQRARRKTLTTEQRRLLEAIPGWSWTPHDAKWHGAYESLIEYLDAGGSWPPPRDHSHGGVHIGAWVTRQRALYRARRLSPDRIEKLESVPGWTWEVQDDFYEQGLACLRAYAAREGHARVPQDHVELGLKLGSWVSGRRADHQAGRLDPARVAELEAIPGWSWDLMADDWAAALAALRAFVAREGHARVPPSHVEGDVRLGSWVQSRRREHRRGRLDQARAAELVAIPGWTWDPRADAWAASLAALHAFVAREGHARVPHKHVEGTLRLGAWVSSRRADYRAGRLDSGRVAELEALPGWTWTVRRKSPEDHSGTA